MPDGAVIAVQDSGLHEFPPQASCAHVGAHAAPDKPVLLCIHGWAADSRFFDLQAQALSAHFRVVRPDLRGHGASSRLAPFTLDQLARDCAAIAEALNLDRVIVVGWSMGAMVAWRAMASDPAFAARIAGLVVIDMAARITNGPDWDLGLSTQDEDSDDSARLTAAMRRDWPAFAAAFTPNVFAPNPPPGLTALSAALFANNDPTVMAAFWTSMAETDCRADVASIGAPMLICYGDHSRLYHSQSAHWLAGAAGRGHAVGFAHSGHAPHLEEPELFNRLTLEFAGTIDAVRPARRDAMTLPFGVELEGQTAGPRHGSKPST
jgi:pimeloyl-[acyl-carrier protein] methyl ester esterase